MNIRYLKLLSFAIPFFLLAQGCSFYAGFHAAKQPNQANVAANAEGRRDILGSENGQAQAAHTNGHDVSKDLTLNATNGREVSK